MVRSGFQLILLAVLDFCGLFELMLDKTNPKEARFPQESSLVVGWR